MEPELYKIIMNRGLRAPLMGKDFTEVTAEHVAGRLTRHIGRATIIDFSPLFQEAESHCLYGQTLIIPQAPIPLPFDSIWMDWGPRKNSDGTPPALFGVFCTVDQESPHDEFGPECYKQKVTFLPISTSPDCLNPYLAGWVSVWLDEQYRPIEFTRMDGKSSVSRMNSLVKYNWGDDIEDSMRRVIKAQLRGAAYLGCFALRWINAMNIHLQKKMFAKKFVKSMERKGKRKSGGYKYYVLTIDKAGQGKRSRRGGVSQERLTALHLRRGHFKHFTEEKPMFGKAGRFGDFWWRPAVLGDAKNGVIDKDYKAGKSNKKEN